MARRFRRPMRQLPRGNQPHWSAEQWVLSPAAGALSYLEIYASDLEAEVNALVDAEPTVHRIILRGAVTMSVVGLSNVALGICLVPSTLTPGFGFGADAGNANSLFQDDWLFTERFGLGMASLVGDVARVKIDADIRTKRKLKERDRLVASITNAAGGAVVSWTGHARILHKLNL